jgi:hypothetical protein
MSKLRRKQIDLVLSEGPTDGTYGVINAANIQNTDKVEDAFDKVATILDALVPPAAPNLTSMSENIAGVTGILSFGASNTIANYNNHPTVNANQTYSVAGNSQGIINGSTNASGTLANNVIAGPGTPNAAYPANAFGNADKGVLRLILDGVIIHTVNLTSFGSGSSTNANGSGFNLSAATSVVFPAGTTFPGFKYRTGTWTLNAAEWTTSGFGYKTIQVTHVDGATTYSTQTYNFIIDNNTTAITVGSSSLHTLSMTGSRLLSGVNYHQSGTAQYNITLNGVYLNTYSNSASAISHPTVTNCTAVAQAIPAFVTNQSDAVTITNKTVTVNSASTRILGAAISISTNVLRTVQATATGLGSQSQFSILLDTVTGGSTDTAEGFDVETYRMTNLIESNKDVVAGYASGGTNPYTWSSSQSLVGASATHNDGLMVFNSSLRYPTNTAGTGITSGNFSAVVDGPAGNVNYSGAAGTRVYYRYFWLPSKSNFVMNVTATSTTFVTAATSPSANNLTIEILAPSQTKNGGGVTEWKDCVTAYTTDSAIGAYNASGGNNVGNTAGANWGLTIGTKTTANSGNVIVVRVRAASAWTGNISQLNIA